MHIQHDRHSNSNNKKQSTKCTKICSWYLECILCYVERLATKMMIYILEYVVNRIDIIHLHIRCMCACACIIIYQCTDTMYMFFLATENGFFELFFESKFDFGLCFLFVLLFLLSNAGQ